MIQPDNVLACMFALFVVWFVLLIEVMEFIGNWNWDKAYLEISLVYRFAQTVIIKKDGDLFEKIS